MIHPPRTATAHVPGSKSAMARALLIAALADGVTNLRAPLTSTDTVAFADCLTSLGMPVQRETDIWTVSGRPSGPVPGEAAVWCHDSGTASRFVSALAALGHGRYVIDASAQMRARPMAPLIDSLRELGVRIDTEPGGRLPFVIHAAGVPGGPVRVDAGVSSQYLTALCLIAPATEKGLRIEVTAMVSEPYVELTIDMMRAFGATVHREGNAIVIPPATYRAQDYLIEPDASTASYFFAAAAITGNTVVVPGLGDGSRQGDLRFATEILASMGCAVDSSGGRTTVTGPADGVLRSPGSVDMRDISDTMMTLAAIAPYADAPVRITNVANCRVKESDRIDAITTALKACGISTRTGPDWLEITPGQPSGAEIVTRADHRIAMSMSVTGLRAPGITLDDPACVAKTFPGFHEEFAALRGKWADGGDQAG